MEVVKPSRCRFLRTKATYTPDADFSESWRNGNSSTAQYWCLCTMGSCGPDQDLVAPELCQIDRRCYRSADVLA
jgi:hypothetical protein